MLLLAALSKQKSVPVNVFPRNRVRLETCQKLNWSLCFGGLSFGQGSCSAQCPLVGLAGAGEVEDEKLGII